MVPNRRGVSRKVMINSILLVLFLIVAITLFFLLRNNAPPLLQDAAAAPSLTVLGVTRGSGGRVRLGLGRTRRQA